MAKRITARKRMQAIRDRVKQEAQAVRDAPRPKPQYSPVGTSWVPFVRTYR